MAYLLNVNDLNNRCNSKKFTFSHTKELPIKQGTIGQTRALNAIDLGLELNSDGFNIYILGENGTGRTTSLKKILSQKSSLLPTPQDWCYLNNFSNPDKPISLSLPAGQGKEFSKDMDNFIETLKSAIPKKLFSKDYEHQQDIVENKFKTLRNNMFVSIEKEAKELKTTIKHTDKGFFIVPINSEGKPFTENDYASLTDKEKKERTRNSNILQNKLDDILRDLRVKEEELNDKLSTLERKAVLEIMNPLTARLKDRYSDKKLNIYLDDVMDDIIDDLGQFIPTDQQTIQSPNIIFEQSDQKTLFSKYKINVITDHKENSGAPVIVENNPTYYNLFGRIEHKLHYGGAITDFSMIKSGSLHQANGGYLIINAVDLLKNIFSYESLKRALKNKEVRIEDIWEQYRLISTTMVKPEPITLNVKIILIGTQEIYYLLFHLDEEYKELFKIKADFDNKMERSEENIIKYANFIAVKSHEEKLLPFDTTGVARIVEFGSRIAEHQHKLSSKFSIILDLLRESDYWAKKDKSNLIIYKHVKKALDERIHRHNKIEKLLSEMILDDSIIIESGGELVGQINGLAVMDLGDHIFGKPSRISAVTYTGKSGVVNIDREIKLSGKIHNKSTLIIKNYLGSKYAINKPITLSAAITFEQLYGMIEGDSATCAEFYALVSSIAKVPIRQDIAVTGSMDQYGNVQPIGGVNEKIEGFFDICNARGLSGSQGVIIPKRNVKNLMLRSKVLHAVTEGKFHIYSIKHIEDGMELLSGKLSGKIDGDNNYPEGSFNYLINKGLSSFREAMKKTMETEKCKN